MKFVDEVTVSVKGGDGGDGAIGWHREKFVPKGGPDGGDGGDGGSIFFHARTTTNSLIEQRFSPHIVAGNGESGRGNNQFGKRGENKVVIVPVGTQVYWNSTLVADLNQPDARWIAARGGKGGLGNTHFKSSTRRAPWFAQKGVPGETFELKLTLKSIADVGLVGFPNAGKSSLISTISASKPKIADYPFTTLEPNVGVVRLSPESSFVVADIPGIIPGAHSGKGLGLKFLKHIERTKLLVFIIDPTNQGFLEEYIPEDSQTTEPPTPAETAIKQYDLLRAELEAFSEDFKSYPFMIVVSKTDLPDHKECLAELEKHFYENPPIGISSLAGLGLDTLVHKLAAKLSEASELKVVEI